MVESSFQEIFGKLTSTTLIHIYKHIFIQLTSYRMVKENKNSKSSGTWRGLTIFTDQSTSSYELRHLS